MNWIFSLDATSTNSGVIFPPRSTITSISLNWGLGGASRLKIRTGNFSAICFDKKSFLSSTAFIG